MNSTDESGDHGSQLCLVEVHRSSAQHCPVGVQRVGGNAEDDPADVLLVEILHEPNEASEAACRQDQQTSGHGVEGAGMSDLLHSQQPSCPSHHVVAGQPTGLVDEEEAVHSSSSMWRSNSAIRAPRSMLSSTSKCRLGVYFIRTSCPTFLEIREAAALRAAAVSL